MLFFGRGSADSAVCAPRLVLLHRVGGARGDRAGCRSADQGRHPTGEPDAPEAGGENPTRGEFREDLFYIAWPKAPHADAPPLRSADKRALIRNISTQEAAAAPKVSLSEDLITRPLTDHMARPTFRQLRNVLRAMIALRTMRFARASRSASDYRLRAQAPAREIDCSNIGREREALLRALDLDRGNISHVARKARRRPQHARSRPGKCISIAHQLAGQEAASLSPQEGK